MKLVLLRHGETIWNKEDRFTGWTDVDLSAKAHKVGSLTAFPVSHPYLTFRQIVTRNLFYFPF